MPHRVHLLIREAERRIRQFQLEHHIPGFLSSNMIESYRILAALADIAESTGQLFCEWGSGHGIVACLAAMLEFDVYGIEIEGELVEAASELAEDFELDVEFIHGSILPKGYKNHIPVDSEFAWLHPDAANTYEEMGLMIDDFDIIFAYPWPDEECLTERLFLHYAKERAILVSHHGSDELLVRQKFLS